MDTLASKTAFITGASSGIGKAAAIALTRAGYRVIGTSRTAAPGEMRDGIRMIACDVTDDASVAQAVAQAHGELGRIDLLVNNAGYGTFGEFKDTALSATLGMMQLNMNSVVVLTKLFLPDLLSTKGKLLNVASTAAFQPGPFMAVYYATKSFVLYFSEGLACELEGTGVTVTALCPGPTASGFQDKAVMQASALVKNKKLPSAQSVAASGYAAMKRGKRVHITGLMNNIMAQSIRFTPRNWVTALLKQLTQPI